LGGDAVGGVGRSGAYFS